MKTLLALIVVNALYFTLPGNSKRCIEETLTANQTLSGQFMISGESERLVFTRLLDPTGQIVYRNPLAQAEGSFLISNTLEGQYRFCFQAFDRAAKSVSFHLRIVEAETSLAVDSDIDPLEESIGRMAALMDRVKLNIRFFQRRERIHRDLAEHICDRVLWTAVVKVAVIVAVAGVQVAVLLRGFTTSSGKV